MIFQISLLAITLHRVIQLWVVHITVLYKWYLSLFFVSVLFTPCLLPKGALYLHAQNVKLSFFKRWMALILDKQKRLETCHFLPQKYSASKFLESKCLAPKQLNLVVPHCNPIFKVSATCYDLLSNIFLSYCPYLNTRICFTYSTN